MVVAPASANGLKIPIFCLSLSNSTFQPVVVLPKDCGSHESQSKVRTGSKCEELALSICCPLTLDSGPRADIRIGWFVPIDGCLV